MLRRAAQTTAARLLLLCQAGAALAVQYSSLLRFDIAQTVRLKTSQGSERLCSTAGMAGLELTLPACVSSMRWNR